MRLLGSDDFPTEDKHGKTSSFRIKKKDKKKDIELKVLETQKNSKERPGHLRDERQDSQE